MTAVNYQVLLFYKYTHMEDPEAVMVWQRELCERWELKGRLIIAHEGINFTMEGTVENTEAYIQELTKDPRFADIQFKRSAGTGQAFPKLSVKVRPEIVSLQLGGEDVNPTEVTGKYVTADQMQQILNSDEEYYIVDMRNDYEHRVGYFQGSVLAPISNFRELPEKVAALEHLKDKKVITVCTGGVRCEKASGYLINQGFKDVSQLHGGIVSYMEKYPNQAFKGKLYVFDNRLMMGFETDAPEHEVVGKCGVCGKANENYINCKNDFCHDHFICCAECMAKLGGYCESCVRTLPEPTSEHPVSVQT
jgi:UPF0176 protein